MQAPEHTRHHKPRGTAYARTVLAHATADLTGFYERIATLVGRPVAGQVLLPVTVPAFTGLDGNGGAAPDRRGQRGGRADRDWADRDWAERGR